MRPLLASLFTSLVLVAACGGASKKPTAGAAGHATAGIRSIDWLNRTYTSDAGPTTVKDGHADVPIDPEMPDMQGYLDIAPPTYGDVDGDGVEDAIIISAFNGGGTGIFTQADVFTLRPGATEPTLIGSIPGGDRGDGGLVDIRFEGGKVLVDRNHSTDEDGTCCPSKLVHEVWTWTGGALVEDEAARQIVDNPDFQRE